MEAKEPAPGAAVEAGAVGRRGGGLATKPVAAGSATVVQCEEKQRSVGR